VCIVCCYVASCHSHLLGYEWLTTLVVCILWDLLLYVLNQAMTQKIGLMFSNPNSFRYGPVLVLVSPFLVFNVFIHILGSAWRN